MFERFSQADSSPGKHHSGLGLGLAIVKSLTEMHGGTVRVKSAGAGKGATFLVTLPISVVHASPDDRGRQHPTTERDVAPPLCPHLAGVHVLVVDDDPDARELVKRDPDVVRRAGDDRDVGGRGAGTAPAGSARRGARGHRPAADGRVRVRQAGAGAAGRRRAAKPRWPP